MSKQEKIVCAAVRTNEHGTKIRLYVEYPEHIKQDKQIYGVFGECSHERGFITNKNRFVDPKEAMQIAIKEGQIKELAELDLIIREFEEYEEESGIETNQLMLARESYGYFYHQFAYRELKLEDLY